MIYRASGKAKKDSVRAQFLWFEFLTEKVILCDFFHSFSVLVYLFPSQRRQRTRNTMCTMRIVAFPWSSRLCFFFSLCECVSRSKLNARSCYAANSTLWKKNKAHISFAYYQSEMFCVCTFNVKNGNRIFNTVLTSYNRRRKKYI